MKIKKILNNNAILVGEDGRDFIWLGTGLGFQMKPGLMADESKIEKIFVLEEKTSFQRLKKLIISIPIEYFSLTDDIVRLAKANLDSRLSEMLYVSLTDHLYNLIKLHKQGIVSHNRLFWEIKKSYPKEFEIGQQALWLIKKKMDVKLEDEEASNIAMHLVNAQLNDTENEMVSGRIIAKKIRDIITIIRLSNQLSINEASLAYNRFITHLRFFFQRLNDSQNNAKTNPLLLHVKEQYYQAFHTMKLVEEYLESSLNDDEQLYLTLHIQKLIEND
ncbi:PRD domain-containing protein [Enterococcus faecalis]|nr:PRD domain-containing protein [Enterococcus faecalis]